jgi:hypothetical protein
VPEPGAGEDSGPRLELDGFYSLVGPFRLSYVDPERRALMSEDWSLDNWETYPDGSPREPREGEGWTSNLAVDLDGDGTADAHGPVPTFDLRFSHRRDGALVWIRTIPVSERVAERDLSVVAHDYVEEAAGANYSGVCFGGCVLLEESRYATTAVAEGEAWVAGVVAYDITFDMANVDQLLLDASARSARLRVVIVRPGYRTALDRGLRPAWVPVVVVIGYVQVPDRFDEHVAEFEALLRRIDFWPGGVPDEVLR